LSPGDQHDLGRAARLAAYRGVRRRPVAPVADDRRARPPAPLTGPAPGLSGNQVKMPFLVRGREWMLRGVELDRRAGILHSAGHIHCQDFVVRGSDAKNPGPLWVLNQAPQLTGTLVARLNDE